MNALFRDANTNTGPLDVFSRNPYFGFRRVKYMDPPMKPAAPINIVMIPGHLRRFSVSMLADDTFRVPNFWFANSISDVPTRIPLESE
jgi:hypothetical protein